MNNTNTREIVIAKDAEELLPVNPSDIKEKIIESIEEIEARKKLEKENKLRGLSADFIMIDEVADWSEGTYAQAIVKDHKKHHVH